MDWIIEQAGYSPDEIADLGNRFLVGNGYMGMRGTLDEYRKDQLVAINLTGIYHKAGDGWREPLNAPNPLFARLMRAGTPLGLPDTEATNHRQALDIEKGLHMRQTDFGQVSIQSERFVSMDNVHLLCMRYEAHWTDDAAYTLEYGIDADVWDINGPHYTSVETGNGWVLAGTDQGQTVAVAMRAGVKNESNGLYYTVCAAVYTSNDCDDPLSAAKEAVAQAGEYETLKAAHVAVWNDLWSRAEVTIEGDPKAEQALNYSLYHLMSIAPRHAQGLSVAARGLSGQTYKGAVFWDTEMFMLDFYLSVMPGVARTTLQYRIDTLPGALEKAAGYGYKGAFYAWESQEGGFDACSDYNVTDVFTGRPMRTYFKDRQYHITAAVVYGLCKYQDWTGDDDLMANGGLEVLVQAARFYQSLLMQHVGSDVYEILGAVGPDEYHERVDNNAYTNEMARMVLKETVKRLHAAEKNTPDVYRALEEKLHFEAELHLYEEAAARIKEQKPNAQGVIEQFDGYFALEDVSVDTVRSRLKHPKEYWGGAYGVAADTQVIKQADVITLLYLMRDHYGKDALRANYDYYEPRTEHGSSLSACMYSLVACLLGRAEAAYPLFMKSAMADLVSGGKQWAGLVYIGGTHPAAAGGAYMVLLHGFLGAETRDGGIMINPCMPEGWQKVRCKVHYRGKDHVLEWIKE